MFTVSAENWRRVLIGFGSIGQLPEGGDWVLLGAFAAYSGSGGIGNVYTTNWMRDKGYGMGGTVGYIPSVMADAVPLPPHGNIFPITPEVPRRLARLVALRSPRPMGDFRIRIVRRHGAGRAVHRAIRAGRHRGG